MILRDRKSNLPYWGFIMARMAVIIVLIVLLWAANRRTLEWFPHSMADTVRSESDYYPLGDNMSARHLELLHASVDKWVKITTCDGESLIAKVLIVSEEDHDIVYELVSTSRESQYEKFDQQPAYRITFQEIASVEADCSGRFMQT